MCFIISGALFFLFFSVVLFAFFSFFHLVSYSSSFSLLVLVSPYLFLFAVRFSLFSRWTADGTSKRARAAPFCASASTPAHTGAGWYAEWLLDVLKNKRAFAFSFGVR